MKGLTNMADNESSNVCYEKECQFNYPYQRPHYHVVTNNGTYVKYIVEKPKKKDYD